MNDVDALLVSLDAARLVVRDLTVEDYVQAAGGSFPSSQRPEDLAVTQGPAFSGFIDGQLAVVGGIQIPWAGVGHGWCMLTDVGRAHGGIVHRAVVTYLRAIVHDHRAPPCPDARAQRLRPGPAVGGTARVSRGGGAAPIRARGRRHDPVRALHRGDPLMPVSLIRPMRYPDDGEALGALYQACHATWPKRAPLWWFTHPTLVLEDHGALIGSTSFSLSLPRPLS